MASSEVNSPSSANGKASSNNNANQARDTTTENKKTTTSRNTPRSAPTPEFHTVMAPTSPTYPPYGATYIDPVQLAANGYEVSGDPVNLAYVYPVSPQFSVQYYPDYSSGYQSYPGSPSLHPQSPPINPTSPPFSPTLQYQQIALSPPTHAYVLPPHSTQPFPPLHITSPVLTGRTSIPGSPPHQYLPGPYIIQTDTRSNKKHSQHHNNNHQQQRHQQQHQHYQFHNQPMPPLQQLHSEDGSAESAAYHTHNIYVRGLPPSTTDESFLEMCQVYGSVASSKAIIDQKTGECKGYGFAMFNNEKECEEAIAGLNKTELQASYAKVGQESFSSRLRNLQDETSTNIYISNLPLDYTEQKLEELFQPYQTVSNRILRDPQSGLSRGVGFARMSDREAASAIIDKFNGHTIEGSSAPLQVRFADSPAQKKLKSQTARSKRVIRPREFQPMATFAMRPIMPITPETMLGIAPANTASASHHAYFAEHPQFAAHVLPRPIYNNRQQQQQQQPTKNKHVPQNRPEEDELAEDMQKKMNIAETSTN